MVIGKLQQLAILKRRRLNYFMPRICFFFLFISNQPLACKEA